MKHRGKEVLATAKKFRIVEFLHLDSGTQMDIALCVKDHVMSMLGVDDVMDVRWREPDLDVWPVLKEVNPKLPMLKIDPSLLDACRQRSLYEDRVQDYEKVWKGRPLAFPPVVIDTGQDEWVLCEGGHRACSAERVGVDKILAVDIAELDYDPILVGLELSE